MSHCTSLSSGTIEVQRSSGANGADAVVLSTGISCAASLQSPSGPQTRSVNVWEPRAAKLPDSGRLVPHRSSSRKLGSLERQQASTTSPATVGLHVTVSPGRGSRGEQSSVSTRGAASIEALAPTRIVATRCSQPPVMHAVSVTV